MRGRLHCVEKARFCKLFKKTDSKAQKNYRKGPVSGPYGLWLHHIFDLPYGQSNQGRSVLSHA